ncbi:hypothetical protein G7Z17_g7737 [Cylindrodendrum hubeiense]|uniref:DNA2/NAM7 helicase helicase domain-containing protein n=1 Tax=Cylindrodendrum hubeiense TaxID=595255 RepID=A0A9P5HCL5_9HYPO|nr:hypothetical protein G7Z17_g7737 [Cylindrodendrum hubeiense]
MDIDLAYEMSIPDFYESPSEYAAEQHAAFVAGVANLILPKSRSPDSAVVAAMPGKPEWVQLEASSVKWAQGIVAAYRKDGFRVYLHTWMVNHMGREMEHPSGRGEPWHATRVPLPHGTMANVALFSVRTPGQYGWPPRFKKPPVNPEFPTVASDGRLNVFLQDLAIKMQANDPALPTVEVKLMHTVATETARAEHTAVTAMSAVPKTSRAAAYWKYTLDFQAQFPSMGFLKTFPCLEEALDAGVFGEEHSRVLANLRDVAGYAFVNGGPGSGKSSFGAKICDLILASSPKRRIAWISPSDDLVDNACNRLTAANPNATVRRILPWKAEYKNLTDLPPQPQPIDISRDGASPSELKMAKHLNFHAMKRFNSLHPSRIETSMSNLAGSIAKKNRRSWFDYLRGLEELRTDLTAYEDNFKRRRAAARALLVHAIKCCNAICATPVAFAQMMDHVPDLAFGLIVVDDAGQIPETSALISVSKCPHSPHIFLGDSQQSPPTSLVRDNRGFKDSFGPQRAMSQFKRIDAAGAMTATLGHGNI